MGQFLPISPDVSPERLKTTDRRIRNCLEKKAGLNIDLWKNEEINKIRERIKYLADSYFNHRTEIDYSSKHTQIAYAIAYYPNYVEGLTEILKAINQEETNNTKVTDLSHSLYNAWVSYFAEQERQRINLVCFGSGPAPELYSFKRFLDFLLFKAELTKKNWPKVSVDLFEIEKAWNWSLDNITKVLMCHEQQPPERKMNINFQQYDLTKPISSIDEELKQEYHLIFIQNLANEIPKSEAKTNSFIKNLKLFIKRLKPGVGYCVIATRGYQPRKLLSLMTEYVEQEDSLELVIKGKKIDLNADSPLEKDPKIVRYIYEGIPSWDYRSSDNKPYVIALKSVGK